MTRLRLACATLVGSDPRSILLTDHKEIVIVIGTPPTKIPARGNFATA